MKRFSIFSSTAFLLGALLSCGSAYAQAISIDAGGKQVNGFAADEDFSGGLTDTTTQAVNAAGVPYAAPEKVYLSERYGLPSSPMSYVVPGLIAGDPYIVRLHFADTTFSTPGQRIFDVAINGVIVLANFDIIASAGAANTAIVESFPATANAAGQITINFIAGAADNPEIRAVQVLPGESGTPPTSTSPAPIPRLAAATPMGTVIQNAHVIGRDGTWSAAINGNSYWSFNDTSLNELNAEGANFISNTRSWTNGLDASNGITLSNDYLDSSGLPTEFFPFTAAETQFNAVNENSSGYPASLCSSATDPTCGEDYAIWPGPVVPVPNSPTGRVYHFYALIQRGGPISGFDVLGTGIAVEDYGVIKRPILSPGTPYPTLFWQGSQIGYASGGMVQNGYLYMLGCGNGQANFGYQQCYLGRAPVEDVATTSAWTYYNSTTGQWTPDQNAAEQSPALFSGGPAGNSIQYDKALGVYLTVYTATYVNDVRFRVAPAPWGPWSAEQAMFTGLPSINAGGATDYGGRTHPEFQEKNGLIQYVTYIQDDGSLGFNGQNIQLVKVQFTKP